MSDEQECLHCLINETLDAYHERVHLSTGKLASGEASIDHLIACAAELIAGHDDAKTRKFMAKREAEKLLLYVRKFREAGRYPGGPGVAPH